MHLPENSRRRVVRIVLLWSTAIAVAAALDRIVADAMRQSGAEAWLHHHPWLEHVLKSPGEAWFTLLIAAAVCLAHRLRWRGGALLLLAATISGVNGISKWIVGRTRPFKLFDPEGHAYLAPFELHPFRGGIPGIVHQTNLCFPSGHVAWAFATAATMSILLPRWRGGFYAVAVLVAAERVAENAHWLSDVVVAAALGVASVWLVRRVWWDRWCSAQASASHATPDESGLIAAARAPNIDIGLHHHGSNATGQRTLPVAGDSCLQ
ncbi:phosphatase PAP2 family protein [Fontivita pretiosa]|uniref:phosphatase PAP2 family protein n=1 Tax=Fontivita pretiosa TaxID=2989684 RepID=UPI003D16F0DA